MRDEGRDVDEVAGAGLGDELELVAPAHARLAAHTVDHALDRAVMMRAGLGLGVDDDGAGPKFFGTGAGVSDGRGAVHARGLRGIDVELVGVDDAHAAVFPFRCGSFTHGGAPFAHYGVACGELTSGGKPRGGEMMKVGTLLVAVLSAAAGAAAAETPLERGKYLVEGILTCGNCHTPRVQGGALDAARLHAGGPQTWETSEYRVKGANITPDGETGIGGWSADEVLRAIRDGVRPNGQQLSPPMPDGICKILTPADLEAVVAYVRSLPAVSRKVAGSGYQG